MRISFANLFTQALGRQYYLDKEKRSYKHSHPSEITGCARAFWYKVNDTPISNEPSTAMQLIWEQGHAIQEVLEKLLPLIPELEDWMIEVPLWDEEHNVGGSCDLVAKVDGKWYVLDFKTAGATRFREVQRKGPPLSYKWQVMLYMYMLKKKDPREFKSLDSAVLLYVNRGPVPDEIFLAQGRPRLVKPPFYEVIIQYDQDILETEILPQVEYLEEVRGMSSPPKKVEDEQECMFCEYRTYCKEDKR